MIEVPTWKETVALSEWDVTPSVEVALRCLERYDHWPDSDFLK